MDKQRIAEVHVAIASGYRPQAKQDIIEADRQIFVEPADLLKNPSPYRQARTGNSSYFMCQLRQPLVATTVLIEPDMSVISHPLNPKHNAAVLDATVGIQQFGANCPYILPHRI